MREADDFYDRLAPFFHLIYADWNGSISRQACQIKSILAELSGSQANSILDAACGIGTQSLGLAQLGYAVTASDLSAGAVERARREAERRGLSIDFSVADMRELFEHHQREFDVVIACDNSIPHLLSDQEIRRALEQMHRCTSPGGCCLVSVRDYAEELLSGVQMKPYGVRQDAGQRYVVFQVWEFFGEIYELSLYLMEDAGEDVCQARVMRTRYYAISVERLTELMQEAGFVEVTRLDGRYFQPVLVGRRAV